MSPFWQRRPQIVDVTEIDLNDLGHGITVMVRTGSSTYWLTTTKTMTLSGRAYGIDYVTGVAVHATHGAAPTVSPLYGSASRMLCVGEKLMLGIEHNLAEAEPTAISTIRVYDLKGVKKPKVRRTRLVPSNGVDLAMEEAGTVVRVQAADGSDIHLTLAEPSTRGDELFRGTFITRKHGDQPLMTPYAYTVTRHIAPGRWLHVLEGEGAQEREFLRFFVGGVSVNGVPRE